MLRRSCKIGVCLIGLCLLLCVVPRASADESPNKVIDKTNWEEVEGLVPHTILNWLKNGKLILHLGELSYDPAVYLPQFALDALQSNIGKYDIDEEGWIVEVSTAKPAKHIIGYPFPKIEMDDPRVAEKIVYNKIYTWYLVGDNYFTYQMIWIGASGHERTIELKAQQMALQGWPGIKDRKNPDLVEKRALGVATSPVDVKGTATMGWRYMSPNKQDSTFGFIPAIRRVRQMSPANRSDAVVGSDFCIDDSNGYDGKVQAFNWKLLREQEAIVPYLDENPQTIIRNAKNEWCTTKQHKPVVYGYDKEGWQGAPWAPTNCVWVKRPVYVLEMWSKDKYYNYGTQYLWIDKETYASHYKVIHDRSGEYWKSSLAFFTGNESPDGAMRTAGLVGGPMVDDRYDHASGSEIASPRNIVHMFAELNPRDFTIAGFAKFCQ
jgi:hypothetical protein